MITFQKNCSTALVKLWHVQHADQQGPVLAYNAMHERQPLVSQEGYFNNFETYSWLTAEGICCRYKYRVGQNKFEHSSNLSPTFLLVLISATICICSLKLKVQQDLSLQVHSCGKVHCLLLLPREVPSACWETYFLFSVFTILTVGFEKSRYIVISVWHIKSLNIFSI